MIRMIRGAERRIRQSADAYRRAGRAGSIDVERASYRKWYRYGDLRKVGTSDSAGLPHDPPLLMCAHRRSGFEITCPNCTKDKPRNSVRTPASLIVNGLALGRFANAGPKAMKGR